MISIDTKRLHLRNVLQNDVDAIFDYRNNEICARYQRGQIKDFEEIQNLMNSSLNPPFEMGDQAKPKRCLEY